MSAIADALTDPVSTAAADPNMSGTRLKTQRYVGADGSSAFLGMYDSQLGVPCSFSIAADGTSRCLPGYSAAAIATFFADSGCAQRIGYASPGCASPKYAYWSDTSSCLPIPTTHIYSIAGPYSGTLYSGSPGACTAEPSLAASYIMLYSLGSELAASTFVQATVTTDP
jgi:hypothetical protein